jgi:two-component system LytT family response regulator
MKVILVDDDKAMSIILKRMLKKINGVEVLSYFNNSEEALNFVNEYHMNIDLVFLDIEMPEENGMDLAKKINTISPLIEIIFITSHREYAVEAFDICAFDYIVKPVTQERVIRTIERAAQKKLFLNPKNLEQEKNISVHLFGGIDVNSKNLGVVKWISAKSMELFAHLLLKDGHSASKSMIIEEIFQGMQIKNAENYLKTSVYQIKKAFENHISKPLIISNNGYYKLQLDDFYIDFLDFEKKINDINEINESNVNKALEAEKIFNGYLLGDRSYYWSVELSEKYLNHYSNLAIKLGKYLFKVGEMQETTIILKKLIKFDPFNEEANCLLMDVAVAQRNKKALTKYYEDYVKNIKNELDIRPEPKVINLYERLINILNKEQALK